MNRSNGKRKTKLRVSESDLGDLRRSGLSSRQIAENGLYTESSASVIRRLLNHGRSKLSSGGLVFPYRAIDGTDAQMVRVKPHTPRHWKGKLVKYEQPVGVSLLPYFPVGSLSAVNEPEVELFITEGEKKALALDQAGFPAIGLSGVYGWSNNKRLAKELREIDWEQRRVFICFDYESRVKTRANVAEAARRLASALTEEGAEVFILRLPPSASGANKQGVDDFLVDQAEEEFRQLVDRAQPAIGPEILSMDQVEPETTEWLWRNYIPRGMLTLLDGDPGLGKSQITIDLVARLTTARTMPKSDEPIEAANCLLLSAEDDVSRTIKPRLVAAGADDARVSVFQFMRDVEMSTRQVSLPGDMTTIDRIVRDKQIRLIVVDPIMAFLGGEIDSNRDTSVRECLSALKEMAERTGATVLMLRHLNKRAGGNSMYRGSGSIAFTAAVRSNLVVGRHPEKEDRFVLASQKNSLGPIPDSIVYSIEKSREVSHVQWHESTTLVAGDIVDHTPAKQATKIQRCINMIEIVLKESGPKSAKELAIVVRRRCPTGERTYKEAIKQSPAVKQKEPGKANGMWFWKLPGQQFKWEKREQHKVNRLRPRRKSAKPKS